jgi:hypothetical protein
MAAAVALFLGAYPVVELSRCIIEYDIITAYHGGIYRDTVALFYGELFLMWLFYLILPVVMALIVDLAYRLGVHIAKTEARR